MLQFKSIPAEIKDVDEKSRVVKGYFSVFGNVDSDNDVIERGAFKRTIENRGPKGSNRIMHLWQHNPTMPLGKPKELYEDEKGLHFLTEISETSYGMDAIKLYRDGVVNEHSIGFEIANSVPETRNGEDVNVLKELILWEGSTVTWGANEMAHGGMKGMTPDYMKERYTTLKQAMRGGDYTDETFRLIEKQLNWLATMYIEDAPTAPVDSKDTNSAPELLEALQTMNLKREIRYERV